MTRLPIAVSAASVLALLLALGCKSNEADEAAAARDAAEAEQEARLAGARVAAEAGGKVMTLRQDMRKLWTDHVIWTRQYIVAAIDDAPDKQAAAQRLMKNQEDIGAAITPYYGREAGDKLTALLKEHITISVELVEAAKVRDTAKFNQINADWKRNGDEIAGFLSSANSHWPRPALEEMMQMHLSTTADEVSARLREDWAGDVEAFDEAYNHILKMSDALSAGIIAQFPDRFVTRPGV